LVKSIKKQPDSNALMGMYLFDVYLVYIAVIAVISSIMLCTRFL